MIGHLETIWELVARASWQASLLAAIVAIVVWCCGERLSARWRYLLLSVVLVRLLLLVTPASPWSMYHLATWPQTREPLSAIAEPSTELVEMKPPGSTVRPPAERNPATETAAPRRATKRAAAPAERKVAERESDERLSRPETGFLAVSATPAGAALSMHMWLAIAWLCGFAFFAGRLLWAYVALRRKLSRCQPVQDEAILSSLESVRQKLGLRRPVAILVTADPVSPCVVGVWRPRLVVPELALTELSNDSLRQVFAHELAHLAHGDLWMNWLMLVGRCVHWFNPVAWWMVREMQSLREMACDERTLDALDADQRASYADTILSLVGLLAPSPLAPGMVALFSSRARLSRRIEHLALGSFGSRRARALACGLLLLLALVGWTDVGRIVAQEPSGEQPPAQSEKSPATSAKEKAEVPATAERFADHDASDSGRFDLRGRTMKWIKSEDGKREWEAVPIGSVDIELYRVTGPMGEPKKIAQSKSDAEGFYSFKNLGPSLWEDRLDRIAYGLVLHAPDRPPTVRSYFDSQAPWPYGERVELAGIPAEVSGRVVNEQGKPVAGATVYQYGIHGEPIPGVQSATTDQDGWFAIRDLSISEPQSAKRDIYLLVRHPDYPKLHETVPANEGVTLTMPDGCVLTGTVVDEVTGKPMPPGIFIVAQEDEHVPSDAVTITDDEGRYRLVVAEGSCNILAESADRVTAQAISHQEATAGKSVELPPITVTPGGWIEGRVMNTKTGKPVVDYRDAYSADQQEPQVPRTWASRVALGLFGPSHPRRKGVMAAERLARVDGEGRFRMRAAAGDNFPYLVNATGQRMMWDTRKQPPVVVKTGETTQYDMLITPKPTNEEKMKGAAEVVAGLPREIPARVEAILAEFRKLNHTVDETEIWCSLMRELVAIGPPAAAALCVELDATDEERMMRRLGFALRALGDPRAVPALIRAIPKTLQPPLSDYGLLVGDAALTKFMQEHDVDRKDRGQYFSLGRPVREVCIALETLTKQDLGEGELYSVVKSEDPSGEAAQRQLYQEQAKKWQAWWEAHWQEFTQDEAYSRVGLPEETPYKPQPFAVLGKAAHAGSGSRGFVLSPPDESGTHFLDLDTGLDPAWPTSLPRSDAAATANQAELTLWAAQNGVDLMCVTYRIGDEQVYALRSFNMRLAEISLRDAKNIESFLERGTLPSSKPVGELLLPWDSKTGRYAPGKAAFLYETREGGLGLVELTDQITEARDITGQIFTPEGVGFHKGVKFNYRRIIP